jgi:hypothetical protein
MSEANNRLYDHACDLLDAVQAFREDAGQSGASETVTPALACLEETLRTLSTACYELAADAAPAVVNRQGRGATFDPSGRLSREQEVQLVSTLHEVAAAFARCARVCRDGRGVVAPLIAKRAAAEPGQAGALAQAAV